jgi:hypothetical protein
MNKKCLACGLVNFSKEAACRRCHAGLGLVQNRPPEPDETSKKLNRALIRVFKRFASAIVIAVIILFGIYFSLLQSAAPLTPEQNAKISRSIEILAEKGFEREVFLLSRTTAFRGTDNWLNRATKEETAYAATNFPFQIVTIYESFFTRTEDEIEQAMILLHEARHLQGEGEPEAYEFVWRNKKKLGWTKEKYAGSRVWQNVYEATHLHASNLFRCDFNPNSDCTE